MPIPRRGDRTPKPCPHGGRHRHGTKSCYQHDVCRCDPCTDAASGYDVNRRRKVVFGRWNPHSRLLDVTETREHVLRLQESGVSQQRIARLAGVNIRTVTRILKGDHPKVQPETAQKILSVPLGSYSDFARVDATGTRRRLQALQCMGWSYQRLARLIGMKDETHIWKMCVHKWVLGSTARRVREVYDRYWDKEPPCKDSFESGVVTRTKRMAKAKGYIPPLGWDDDAIDDPEAKPELGTEPKTWGSQRAVTNEVLDDLDWLRRCGVQPDVAAQRVGFRLDTLQNSARRKDRPEVLLWLLGNPERSTRVSA